MVEGHPSSECNGAYHKDQSPEALLAMNLGRPRFENVAGFHLYRHDLISATQVYTPCNTIDTRFEYPAQDTWIIRNKYTPDKPNCNACIVSKDGPLPLGTHTWKLSPTAVGKPKGTFNTPPKSLSSSSLKLASFRTCFGTGSGFVDAKLTLRLLEMAPVVAATWQLDRVRWLC